jgi:hypothetical protein
MLRTEWIIFAQDKTGFRTFLDLYWVMVTSFSPFFWETKVMDTQSAAARRVTGLICGISNRPLGVCLKNLTNSQVTIFVFLGPSAVLVLEYSQERIAKKSAPVSRLPIAVSNFDCCGPCSLIHTLRGKQAWLFLAGSLSRYAFNCRRRMADFDPVVSLVGSDRRFCLKV